jgi:hypothetical protein
MQMPNGILAAREKGIPQGAPISPLLANLFMHYAFDQWMVRANPGCPFQRFADDLVVHCNTEVQARRLLDDIAARLVALGLELHPSKTRLVYCKDTHRSGQAKHTSFDFLGYTFQGRPAHGRRGHFVIFLPAMSDKAKRRLARRSGTGISNGGAARTYPGSPRTSILSCGAGSTITESSIAPGCTPSQSASTSISFDGPCRSTNDFDASAAKLRSG